MAEKSEICVHNQKGYCKFGDQCRYQHIMDICQKFQCDKSCTMRHPAVCKFFLTSGICKFGDKCAYLHTKCDALIEIETEIKEIKLKLGAIEYQLKAKDNDLKNAIDRIKKLEDSSKTVSKCDYCNSDKKMEKSATTHKVKKPKKSNIPQTDGLDDDSDPGDHVDPVNEMGQSEEPVKEPNENRYYSKPGGYSNVYYVM